MKKVGEGWQSSQAVAKPAVQETASVPNVDTLIQDILDVLRDDLCELADLDVMESFNMDDLEEFMNNEDELHICEPVIDSTTVEAAFQTAIDAEDNTNEALTTSDTESLACVGTEVPKPSLMRFQAVAEAVRKEARLLRDHEHVMHGLMREDLIAVLDIGVEFSVRFRKNQRRQSSIESFFR